MIIPGVLASSQKGGYPPPPVSGYKLWLDGKDNTTFTFSSGNVVSAWTDKSGLGRDFTQSTVANQPTRDSATGLVTFDGSNDSLVAGSKFMDNMHQGANTFFMVIKPTSTNGGPFMDDGAGSSSTIGFTLYNSSSTNFGGYVSRGVSGTSAVAAANNTRQANGTTQLVTIRLIANDATPASRFFFYSNTGTAQQTNSSGLSVSSSASSFNPRLAQDASGGADYYTGSIGEIMWFDTDLSLANRDLVRDWLIAKWGI